jgi:ribosomal protein S6
MSEEKKQYEISFLIKTEADKDAVLQALSKAKAEVISEGRLTDTKLAYPIEKQTVAFFGYIVFEAMPEDIGEIDSQMKFAEGVLRSIIITPPPRKPVSRLMGQRPATNGGESENKESGAEVILEKDSSESLENQEAGKKEIDDAVLDEKLEEILK